MEQRPAGHGDAKALARHISFSRATFYRLVEKGIINPGIKFGDTQQAPRRWSFAEVDADLARYRAAQGVSK
jgi:hypothetical protein